MRDEAAEIFSNADLLHTILKIALPDMSVIDTLKPEPNRPALRLLSSLACYLLDTSVTTYINLGFSVCERLGDYDGTAVAHGALRAMTKAALREVRLEVCTATRCSCAVPGAPTLPPTHAHRASTTLVYNC